jgi:hypothetical protein
MTTPRFILRPGIRRHRDRHADHGHSLRRSRLADPHAKPDGLSERDPSAANEKPFLLLVTGYAADGAMVPDIGKKPLAEIATFV